MRTASLLVVRTCLTVLLSFACCGCGPNEQTKARLEEYGVVTATNSPFTFTYGPHRFYAYDLKGKTEDGRDIEIHQVWMDKKVEFRNGYRFRLTTRSSVPELVIIDEVIRE